MVAMILRLHNVQREESSLSRVDVAAVPETEKAAESWVTQQLEKRQKSQVWFFKLLCKREREKNTLAAVCFCFFFYSLALILSGSNQ